MVKTVVGSFDSERDADRATSGLRDAGFVDRDINLVVSNVQQGDPVVDLPWIESESGPVGKAAVTGGMLGGAFGLAASLAGVAMAGIGSIESLGPLVATLAGAGAGAVAGGMLGTAARLHVRTPAPDDDGRPRASSVVTVRADERRAADATTILRNCGANDIAERDADWPAMGWMGHADATLARDSSRYRDERPAQPTTTAAPSMATRFRSAWQLGWLVPSRSSR